jgi:hypothetical protein
MQLVLDSDGMIKLYRAGVLRQLIEAFQCVIPMAVFNEVVTEGKARGYEGAEAIEAILASGGEIMHTDMMADSTSGLGAGERSILELRSQISDAVVVSDDRRFLTVLTIDGTPFVTPADVLVVMARGGVLSQSEAIQALERLSPLITAKAVLDARLDPSAHGDQTHEQY